MSKFYLSLLFCLAFWMTGCSNDDPRRMTSGEDLYNYYCQSCHEKRGPGAHFERHHTQPPLEAHQVLLLFRYGYRSGDEAHQMPQFDMLSEKQTTALTEHVVALLQQANQK